MLKRNSGISKNKGTSLWSYVPNNGLALLRQIDRVIDVDVDVWSIINWTVVGQQVDNTSEFRRSSASLSQAIVKLCLQHESVARVN